MPRHIRCSNVSDVLCYCGALTEAHRVCSHIECRERTCGKSSLDPKGTPNYHKDRNASAIFIYIQNVYSFKILMKYFCFVMRTYRDKRKTEKDNHRTIALNPFDLAAELLNDRRRQGGLHRLQHSASAPPKLFLLFYKCVFTYTIRKCICRQRISVQFNQKQK